MRIFCTKHKREEDCGKYCIGRIQMGNIYKLSNMPKRFQKELPLVPKNEKDRQSFIKLREFMENVVEHVENGDGLFIGGKTKGTGKTSWACKIMNQFFLDVALSNNLRCRGLYINVPQYFYDLRNSFDNPSEDFKELQSNIRTADLVLWDDIGTESPTNFVRDILYTHVEYRYSHEKSQIFTSNEGLEELKDEKWIGERTVSRIRGCCEVITFTSQRDMRGD